MVKSITLFTFLICFTTISLGQKLPMKEIIGQWDVVNQDAETSKTNDQKLTQTNTPSEATNRLVIKPNGKYTWGVQSGSLETVKPNYAEEGKIYYRISDAKKSTFDFWYKSETDELILLSGKNGKHLATAKRLGRASTVNYNSTNSKGVKAQNTTNQYQVGQNVWVEKSETWLDGRILEIQDKKYKVRYENGENSSEEWVEADRLKVKN